MAEAPRRPMKFPYTLSAKIAQFPHMWLINNSPVHKFWLIGILLSIPIFYKIERLSKNPANVQKWDEIHRKEFSGELAHH